MSHTIQCICTPHVTCLSLKSNSSLLSLLGLPGHGFFTYENVRDLRLDFIKSVNESMKHLTIANCDAEATVKVTLVRL